MVAAKDPKLVALKRVNLALPLISLQQGGIAQCQERASWHISPTGESDGVWMSTRLPSCVRCCPFLSCCIQSADPWPVQVGSSEQLRDQPPVLWMKYIKEIKGLFSNLLLRVKLYFQVWSEIFVDGLYLGLAYVSTLPLSVLYFC